MEYVYDIMDRVPNTVYRNGVGAAVRSFAYAYDPDGLLTQRVTVADGGAAVTDSYAYDGLGRLASADGKSYAYDLAGNRMSAGSRSWTYTHNRDDGVFYDAAGNVTGTVGRAGVTNALLWNTQGQLVSVSTNGAFAESYRYDALGRRVSTTDNGGTVYHIYDGSQCVADVDASGTPLRVYAWGPGIDDLLSIAVIGDETTNVYYAVKDRLGSVCALVGASGQIVESYTYDAWGNVSILTSDLRPLTSSAYGNRYLFQGREYSAATGLYNFRARWYDPETGRWLSKDPIGLEGGLNLYAFCGDDPVNAKDPNGLLTCQGGVSLSAGAAFGGTVGAGIAVSYSGKDGLRVGFYGTGGIGSYIGAGASLTGDGSWSPNDRIDQLNGMALTIGGSFTPLVGSSVGGEVNIPIEKCPESSTYPWLSVTGSVSPPPLSVGSPEIHVYLTRTWTKSWRLW